MDGSCRLKVAATGWGGGCELGPPADAVAAGVETVPAGDGDDVGAADPDAVVTLTVGGDV